MVYLSLAVVVLQKGENLFAGNQNTMQITTFPQ